MNTKSEEKKKYDWKFEKKHAKIFAIISVLAIILILIYTFICLNDGGMFSGLSILIPFFLIPEVLLVIWSIYCLMLLFNWARKKIYRIVLVLGVIALGIFGTIFSITNEKYIVYNSNDVFDLFLDNDNFIIDNDKLYYRVWNYDDYRGFLFELTIGKIIKPFEQDSINVMSLDGKENKILCNNIEENFSEEDYMGDIRLLLLRNDYLYYTNSSDASNSNYYTIRKVNLNTCENTVLLEDYIVSYVEDNYFYSYYNESDSEFIKYDVDKEEIVDKIEIKKTYIDYSELLVDYDKFNVYYVVDDKDIYINDQLLISNSYTTNIFCLNDKYLFYRIEESYSVYKYYRLDLVTKEVIEINNEFNFDYISKIDSYNKDTYFIEDYTIYNYDEVNNKFNKVYKIKDNSNYADKVIYFKNKVLFVYSARDECSVIYDKEKDEFHEYEFTSYSYDKVKDKLYLLYTDDKNDDFFDNDELVIEEVK